MDDSTAFVATAGLVVIFLCTVVLCIWSYEITTPEPIECLDYCRFLDHEAECVMVCGQIYGDEKPYTRIHRVKNMLTQTEVYTTMEANQ